MFLVVVETNPDYLIVSAGHPPACLNRNIENLCSRQTKAHIRLQHQVGTSELIVEHW